MKYLQIKEQLLNEINMSPGSLRRAAKEIGARAGMEFEMIVPGAAEADDDYDMEPDYDSDQSISSIQDAFDFFYDGDYNSRRDCQALVDKMREDYTEWLSEKVDDRWETDKEEAIYDWLRYNVAPSEVLGDILGQKEDENGNYPDPTKEDYRNAAAKVAENPASSWYGDAQEDFNDNFYGNADMEEEWLESADINTMQDVESNYTISWPHYYNPSTGGEVSVEDTADSFSRAIGRAVEASGNYHSRSVTRPSATELHYVVEPDGSLEADDDADGGLEFVSPALPIDELLDDLKKVKAWADKTGCYTNDSTGLHINVSVPAWQGDLSKLDYVKLAVLMGDEYVLQEFGRTGNTYAKSALKIVKDNITQRPEDVKLLLDKMKEHLNTSASKLVHSGATSKYTSVNTKDGYIEFRSPGGDWLNENFDKIETTLLRFVVAMDAAADETKYKEEYAKKLYKLLAGNDKDSTNTMTYFAKYAAGELPQSALKSFIKQAQLERKIQKDPTNGEKYWWRVDKEGRGKTGASVEVVATSKEEALQKAASEWMTKLSALSQAAVYPLRPYDGAGQSGPRYEIFNLNTNRSVEDVPARVGNDEDALTFLNDYILHGPHALQSGQARNMFGIRRVGDSEPILARPFSQGQSSRFEIYRISDGRTVEYNGQPLYVNASGFDDAEERAIQMIAAAGLGAPELFNVRSVLQPPAQNNAPDVNLDTEVSSPTGQWKILDGLGREVYRFRPAQNTETKAKALAAAWAQDGQFDGNYKVMPVGHDDQEPSTPTPGSTNDLAQQRATPGAFTGAWKVLDADGNEIYRFSGIGNNQSDANRVAVNWLRNNGYEHGTDISVVPIMS